ncbi:MAG: thioesterase [Blastochloris sp.]|nr:thioesterase [Blastochloris sp.]
MIRYQPNTQARLRLFCFAYAGGGASIFRPWSAILPPDIEICAMQLPGRENRMDETAYNRLDPLIAQLADVLAPYLDIPFVFFGHSMGALVSFELARHLRRRYNRCPSKLYLAAYRAPHLRNRTIRIHHLPSEVFKVVLRADGIPEKILQNEELMQAMLPTLRADFEVCDTHIYREEAPLSCPFEVYGGLEDVRINKTELEGWQTHTCEAYTLSMFPGAHFFLHSDQDRLLAVLSHSLNMQLRVLS